MVWLQAHLSEIESTFVTDNCMSRSSGINQPPTLQSARNIMSESYVPAMLDACTQTPYPGSELLDPNPFVKTPTKAKAKSARETFGPTRYYVEDQVCM